SFRVVFTNLNAVGRYGPTTLGDHYTGQDHDGQVTLSSGIQQWTVPYTGEYRIEAIGAEGGYDPLQNNSQYRGRGTKMTGTFSLNKFEVIHIPIGQEGGIKNVSYSSGGGGGTFVVREASTPLIIAGGGGGVDMTNSRHAGCEASTNTTGNPGDSPGQWGKMDTVHRVIIIRCQVVVADFTPKEEVVGMERVVRYFFREGRVEEPSPKISWVGLVEVVVVEMEG
ncbi:leukocyte tyrosine kinase receptor-like, partial [Stylophora pistillata]|uniref:leukocyte tyrosine kinase receptor-like n=1 Tax=Stylophora pistillata TaxID=50429 RepID=UPI000C04CEC5